MRVRILALALLAILAVAGPATARELPLGPSWLPEARTALAVAPGVTYTRIERGFASPRDVFAVDVDFTATRTEARALRRRLRDGGYAARIEGVRKRAPDDPQRGPLGYLVRTGAFGEESAADALRAELVTAGYTTARVVFTGEDGRPTKGPWVVHVLEVDPVAFGGGVVPALATDVVPGREPLSGLARRTDALAGLNGGYFVIGAANGTDGDLAGLSVLDGALVSEAVNGRTSLVLPDRTGEAAVIEALSTRQEVVAGDGARRELDGLNRAPGLIRACGGSGGDMPTELPKHDFTCTDASELIRFDEIFGAATEPGPGAEAVLNEDGVVTELREGRGGPIPPAGSVLAGTAEAAAWLRAHAQPGAEIATRLGVAGERGPLTLGPQAGVVNGGPRLLRAGPQGHHGLRRGLPLAGRPGVLLPLRGAAQPAHARRRNTQGPAAARGGRRAPPRLQPRSELRGERRGAAGAGGLRRREPGRRRFDQLDRRLYAGQPAFRRDRGASDRRRAAAARVPVVARGFGSMRSQRLPKASSKTATVP